jgi:hypothetical protein
MFMLSSHIGNQTQRYIELHRQRYRYINTQNKPSDTHSYIDKSDRLRQSHKLTNPAAELYRHTDRYLRPYMQRDKFSEPQMREVGRARGNPPWLLIMRRRKGWQDGGEGGGHQFITCIPILFITFLLAEQ